MCTQERADSVVVCDVSLPDVRRLVGVLPGVELTHLPYAGTRVASSGAMPVQAFRAALAEALAPHGGSLPD